MDDWKDQLARRWASINKKQHSEQQTPRNAPPPQNASARRTEINLGIDFGTSFTKVIYRIVGPDISGIIPFATDAPNCDEPMVPSLLWIDRDFRLYTAFEKRPIDASEIRYFKMHLAGMGIGRSFQPDFNLETPVYRLLCAFYLFRILKASKGLALRIEHLDSTNITWSGNIGIPIGYIESESRPRFEEVVQVAAMLSERSMISDTPTLDELDAAYRYCVSNPDPSAANFMVMSELEAEITSLIDDASTKDGMYVLFDIGGGTVDGAAFSFKREAGEPRVNILTALVAPLGFDATAEEIANSVSSNDVAIALRNGETNLRLNTERVKKSMHMHVSSVIVLARKKTNYSWIESMQELPVFLCGGGRHSTWHRTAIDETYGCNQHANVGIPRYSCMEMSLPNGPSAKYSGAKDHGRFLVAHGLSIPAGTHPPAVGFPRQNPRVEYAAYDAKSILEERMYDLYGELL